MLSIFALLSANDILQTVLDFLQTEVFNVSGFSILWWYLIVAIAVVVILVIIIACCASKKSKKTDANIEKPETTNKETAEIIEANSDKVTPAYEEVKVEPIEEVKVEPVVEPVKEEIIEEPIVEKEEVVATEVETEPVVKKSPKTIKKTEEVATVQKTSIVRRDLAKKEEVEEEKPGVEKKETETTSAHQVVGKIEICNSNLGGFNYILRANNGQLLYESKSYKTKDGCVDAISKFVEATKEGRFTVRADKFKNYKFILKSPTSNNLLYVGESFSTETSCLNNIESVKRFAPISPIVDVTEEDFVAKFEAYSIPEEIVSAVEKGEGAVGKWEIVKINPKVKTSPFVYLLYANNGQLLFESRDYKTYASCKGGLETFVNTVRTGTFVIDPDKTGRFKFVLRSKSLNSSSEYIGQSYDTKKACAHSIESVYRFALRSSYTEL